MTSAQTRREPSEDPEWLRRVCSEVLTTIELPDEYAVAIVGSVAEGFGNEASDVDILVVLPGQDPFGEARFMTGYQEHRVEVFLRGADSLRHFATTLPRQAQSASPETLEGAQFADDIDTYHRICNCHLITDTPVFAEARATFDMAWLMETQCKLARERAVSAWWRAKLAMAFGRFRDARAYGRQALQHAAQFYAAAHGETYASWKFLGRRLERAGTPPELLTRYHRLTVSSPDTLATFLADVESTALGLGVQLPAADDWKLRLVPGTSVGTVGKHLIVGLGERSAVVHESSGSLAETLAAGSVAPTGEHAAALGFLHRVGMLEGARPGATWTDDRAYPFGTLRILWSGVTTSEDHVLVPLAAQSIARLGVDLVAYCFLMENRDEDAVGALLRGDWSTVHASLRAMAWAQACMVLCHHGVYPPPKEHEYLEALSLRPELREFTSLAEELATLEVREARDVPPYHALLMKMRGLLPEGVISRHFNKSHHSGVKWAKVARYVFPPWAQALRQLGGELDHYLEELLNYERNEAFPVSEAGMELMLSWSRNLDLAAEVRRLRVES